MREYKVIGLSVLAFLMIFLPIRVWAVDANFQKGVDEYLKWLSKNGDVICRAREDVFHTYTRHLNDEQKAALSEACDILYRKRQKTEDEEAKKKYHIPRMLKYLERERKNVLEREKKHTKYDKELSSQYLALVDKYVAKMKSKQVPTGRSADWIRLYQDERKQIARDLNRRKSDEKSDEKYEIVRAIMTEKREREDTEFVGPRLPDEGLIDYVIRAKANVMRLEGKDKTKGDEKGRLRELIGISDRSRRQTDPGHQIFSTEFHKDVKKQIRKCRTGLTIAVDEPVPAMFEEMHASYIEGVKLFLDSSLDLDIAIDAYYGDASRDDIRDQMRVSSEKFHKGLKHIKKYSKYLDEIIKATGIEQPSIVLNTMKFWREVTPRPLFTEGYADTKVYVKDVRKREPKLSRDKDFVLDYKAKIVYNRDAYVLNGRPIIMEKSTSAMIESKVYRELLLTGFVNCHKLYSNDERSNSANLFIKGYYLDGMLVERVPSDEVLYVEKGLGRITRAVSFWVCDEVGYYSVLHPPYRKKKSPTKYEITEKLTSGETEGFSGGELRGFVNRFIQATNAGNVYGLMTFYDDTVEFYGKPYTRDDIRKDKGNYYKRWKIVNVKLDGEITFTDKGDNTQEIVFPIKFFVENPDTNKAIAGSAVNTLAIRKIDGQLKIVLEDQKITERREYAPKPLASKPTVQKQQVQTEPKPQPKAQVDAEYVQRFNAAVDKYVKWLREKQPDTTESQKAYLCNNPDSEPRLNEKQKDALRQACKTVALEKGWERKSPFDKAGRIDPFDRTDPGPPDR